MQLIRKTSHLYVTIRSIVFLILSLINVLIKKPFERWLFLWKKINKKSIKNQLRITNYQLRIINEELRITNYQLRITNYQLPIKNYGLPIKNYLMKLDKLLHPILSF